MTQQAVSYQEFISVKQDITDMKSLMSRIVDALTKITVIEERQHNMAVQVGKTLERLDTLSDRQHETEIADALNRNANQRVEQVEVAFRELYLENERNKTRFQTFVWVVRGLAAIVGLLGAGIFTWVAQSGILSGMSGVH